MMRERLLVVLLIIGAVGASTSVALLGSASVKTASAGEARVLYADSVFSWTSATSVTPQVIGHAVGNPGTNTWTYTYVLKNGPGSSGGITTFALAPALDPQSLESPSHWMQTYGFEGRADAAVWTV